MFRLSPRGADIVDLVAVLFLMLCVRLCRAALAQSTYRLATLLEELLSALKED